jgi:hypothetical protein
MTDCWTKQRVETVCIRGRSDLIFVEWQWVGLICVCKQEGAHSTKGAKETRLKKQYEKKWTNTIFFIAIQSFGISCKKINI